MKEYVKIICILDRSGSMYSIISDAIGGFNSFLEEQQSIEGDAKMDIMLFDTEFKQIAINEDISNINPFNHKTYTPGGGTSLYDAIGMSIDNEIDRLGSLPKVERPVKTLCVILTDGDENSSKEYGKSLINKMITEMREDFGWEFIFLAANQDACLTADGLGISKGNSYTFEASGDGINVAYASVSEATRTYRTTDSKDFSNLMND